MKEKLYHRESMVRCERRPLSILDTPEEIQTHRKVPLSPAFGMRIRDDNHDVDFCRDDHHEDDSCLIEEPL
jgi:hypothetical protein